MTRAKIQSINQLFPTHRFYFFDKFDISCFDDRVHSFDNRCGLLFEQRGECDFVFIPKTKKRLSRGWHKVLVETKIHHEYVYLRIETTDYEDEIPF